MGRRAITVGPDAGDFGLQQSDAFSQIVLRIAVKALAGELACGSVALVGRVATEGELVVHCNATLGALRFVSTVCIKVAGRNAIRHQIQDRTNGQGQAGRGWGPRHRERRRKRRQT